MNTMKEYMLTNWKKKTKNKKNKQTGRPGINGQIPRNVQKRKTEVGKK